MTVTKSIKTPPAKPYDSFPLRPHANGQWCKKIRGKVYFFGVWADPEAAVARYLGEVHDLQAGRKPREQQETDSSLLTIKQAINAYLNWAKAEYQAGEISPEHFGDLKRTWQTGVPKVWDINRNISDLKPDDFRDLRTKLGKKKDGTPTSPATVQGHVRRIKSMFSWLVDESLIEHPPAYGAKFSKLTKKQVIQQSNATDDKIFTRDEINLLLADASYRLETMILLGLNAAMGPRDIAELKIQELDLRNGWLESERSKTGVRRCVKLWPETIAALRTVLKRRFRPDNPAYSDHVFITVKKRPFLDKGVISRIFGKLKTKAGINGTNRGFYVLRHVCRDVSNQQSDDNASRWITGHKRSTIDDQYTRTAPRERIEKVCDHVRAWLFGEVTR